MITRIWHGKTKTEDVDKYLNYIEGTGMSDYKNNDRKLSAKILISLICIGFLLISCDNIKSQKISSTMNEALIVIDVQEGFFSIPNYPVYNENKLINNINQLIDSFRKQGKPIIFVRHTDEDLVNGTKPWQVYSKVHSQSDDIYVNKTTPDSFYKTDLLKVLKANNIDSIVIVGLQTDYCIDATCKSAFGKEIPSILASDGHSTYDNSFMTANRIIDYHNKIIGRWFATLKTTNEIINNYR